MAKLPPRVVGSKKDPQKKSAPRKNEASEVSESPVERSAAARAFGIRMMIGGVVVTAAPFFGLQLRQMGDNGHLTWIVGVILLVIGAVSFVAGQSRTTANVTTIAMKVVLWGIIAFMVLIIVVAGGALLVHAVRR